LVFTGSFKGREKSSYVGEVEETDGEYRNTWKKFFCEGGVYRGIKKEERIRIVEISRMVSKCLINKP